jgi:hypothetical protein
VKDEWKFPTPVARLYRFVGKDGAVRTPDGIGTLLAARSHKKGCMVTLQAEREVNRYKAGAHWKIARYYDANEVTEVKGV